MSPAADDLDGLNLTVPFPDGTLVRVPIFRTADAAYTSGWKYAPHYGAMDPDAVDVATLADGTIRRYDNAHEDTKGHELHVAPDPEPKSAEFPGMVALYERFWAEVPKGRGDAAP